MHKIWVTCHYNYFTKSKTKFYEGFCFNNVEDIKNGQIKRMIYFFNKIPTQMNT